jgi:hypothetical protein
MSKKLFDNKYDSLTWRAEYYSNTLYMCINNETHQKLLKSWGDEREKRVIYIVNLTKVFNQSM